MATIVYRLQPWESVDRLVFDACPSQHTLIVLPRDAPPEERNAKLADADILMGSWVTTQVKLSEDDFRAARKLKLLQLMSAGYEHVPLDVAERYGVPVAHFGGSNASVVAEHTILLMLGLLRHLRELDTAVRSGAWRTREPHMLELRGKRVGLLGMGYIGREVAARLRGFLTDTVYDTRTRLSPDEEAALGVRYLPRDELLASSDVVSLHVALTPNTAGLIGARELASMKPGALLVNTSRGPVVDQAALTEALQSGHLGGAGLDVLDPEPPDPALPLLQLPNVLLTPHNAGSAVEVWPRVVATCFDNIERVLHGQPPLHLARPL